MFKVKTIFRFKLSIKHRFSPNSRITQARRLKGYSE